MHVSPLPGAIRSLLALMALVAGDASPASAQPVPLNKWSLTRPMPGLNVDGGIMRMASAGWIRTQPAALDYVLRLEFRAISERAEGAVLLRAYALRPGEGPGTGYRIALHGRDVRKPLGQVTGIRERVRERESDPALEGSPVGEWRPVEIRVEFNRITVTIDGQVVRVAELSDVFAGHIGLEARRGVLEFRRITLEPLQTVNCTEPRPDEDTVIRLATKPDVQPPKMKRSAAPRYAPDAMQRAVTGVVRLEGVVSTDGSMGRVCVTKGLDPDLDVEALAAARQFSFEPARAEGRPVAVLITFEIEFTLHR